MAKIHHVKAAAKDNPKYGIKKGEQYWWWYRRKGRRGFRVCSTKPPDPFQTASSEFTRRLLKQQNIYRTTALGNDLASYNLVEAIATAVEAIGQDASICENVIGDTRKEYLAEVVSSCDDMVSDLRLVAQELGECDDPDMVQSIVSSMEWNIP